MIGCTVYKHTGPRPKETPKEVPTVTVGLEVKRCDECQRGDCTNCFYRQMYAELMALPTCKTCFECTRVEVVRCKDCTSYGDAGKCRNCNLWRDPDDFCSRGKRKEKAHRAEE